MILTCEMKGTPRPHIYWELNRKPVTFDQDRRIFNGTKLNVAREEIHFSRIEFKPLRRFDDGEYKCFGSNYGGILERKYSLDVNCKYFFIYLNLHHLISIKIIVACYYSLIDIPQLLVYHCKIFHSTICTCN